MESCHADPDCEGIEECAFSCACGDDACLLRCAGQSPSEEINKLLGCWNSKCKTAFEPLPKKAHLRITNEECESEATCVEVCNCVHEQCDMESCHADPDCEGIEECAFSCACGDDACLSRCATASMNSVTWNLAMQIQIAKASKNAHSLVHVVMMRACRGVQLRP